MIIWLTGPSGAGKTTLAKALLEEITCVNLDGDEMRTSISEKAGFAKKDRREQFKSNFTAEAASFHCCFHENPPVEGLTGFHKAFQSPCCVSPWLFSFLCTSCNSMRLQDRLR